MTPAAKSKRGRKPKNERAMTPAERKRRQRRREQDPERRELLALIIKRIRNSEQAGARVMRRAVDKFRDVAETMTLAQLRDVAETYKKIHDAAGRSSLEAQTGGRGATEIATIDAAQNNNGRKASTGITSATFEKIELNEKFEAPRGINKWDVPLDFVPPSASGGLRMWSPSDSVWDHIPEITFQMFEGDEEEEIQGEFDPSYIPARPLLCRVRDCDCRVATWVEARQHVEEKLKGAEKLLPASTIFDPHFTPDENESRDLKVHHFWIQHKYDEFRDTVMKRQDKA
jgi:hypothetical protein